MALIKQLTDNGLPMVDSGAITLVVPDDLEKDAVIFTGSQKRATTANNDLNFYIGRINVISCRWLNSTFGGSATKWHLTAGGARLKLYIRQQPDYLETTDGNNWNHTYSVMMRAAAGFSGWQKTWHSLGDGAAYAS